MYLFNRLSIILYFPDFPMKRYSRRRLLDLCVELHEFGNIGLVRKHAIGVRLDICLDGICGRRSERIAPVT